MKTMYKPLFLALATALSAPAIAAGNTLVGWAVLPAATFSDGSTSGQFAAPNPYGSNLPPYADLQPVQGLSAVLPSADDESFIVMTDNGFGAQGNSADALLRLYSLRPDFKTAKGGSGSVGASNFLTGTLLARFTQPSRITLNDANRKLGIAIQADYDNYYNDAGKPAVDPSIRLAAC